MSVSSALGFEWSDSIFAHDVPVHSLERVCFHFQRILPEYVWDAGVLEGNPFTFVEVKTLLDGVTVGGKKISDEQQILNLAASAKELLHLVSTKRFSCTREIFCTLQGIVAQNEALEWGHFRGEGKETGYTPEVMLGEHGRYQPLPTEPHAHNLISLFTNAVNALETNIEKPFTRALLFFLFGALQQFFFDGNKRTSRLIMNGILLSHGMNGLSIPAARAQEFHQKMVRFYLTKNADEMLEMLISCHAAAA